MDEQEMETMMEFHRTDLSIDDGPLVSSNHNHERKTAALRIAVIVFGIASLIMIAFGALTIYQSRGSGTPHLTRDATLRFQQSYVTIPEATHCRNHLSVLTTQDRLAGTEGDREMANYTTNQFKSFGLAAETFEYFVLLSYPLKINITMTSPHQHHCANREPPITSDPSSQKPNLPLAWNGYTANGSVSAEVVYVNYGTVEDFKRLEQLEINLEGKIALARYGGVYRGTKVLLAQERGMSGVLIYSDPFDDGFSRGEVYPKGPWRPEFSVQRGSVQFDQFYPGDPQTPGKPSLRADMERLSIDKANIPRIPVAPISYGDARHILRSLEGELPSTYWQGGLNFSYHLGPGPAVVAMEIEASFPVAPIWNVVGTLEGSAEKDRKLKQVIIGAHRDGWTFGAVDSAIGCAIVLEVARALTHLQKTSHWIPRRTIQFVSWDAEEYGLIGSVEWVEQFSASLSENAVVYLNADGPISGSNHVLDGEASPVLWSLIREAAKMVPVQKGSSETVYDVWLTHQRNQSKNTLQPRLQFLGSGSDYTGFYSHLLIPSATFAYGEGGYIYHSIYDSFTFYEKFIDPSFEAAATFARVLGIVAMKIADEILLPFDYVEYGLLMASQVDSMRTNTPHLNFSSLMESIHNFATAAAELSHCVNTLRQMPEAKLDMEEVNRLNEKLMKGERQLLRPEGLHDRPWYKHPIFATPKYEGYLGMMFPDLWQYLWDEDFESAQSEIETLAVDIQRAASYLAE